LLPPAAAAANSARRSLLTRFRAVPLGDHGDDAAADDEHEEAESARGDENETPTPTPPPAHPRRARPSSRDTARALEALRGPGHQKIGAEYGEGFVQFRAGGQPLSLDVDALNERLSPAGALRLRRALVAPDEAHGVRERERERERPRKENAEGEKEKGGAHLSRRDETKNKTNRRSSPSKG